MAEPDAGGLDALRRRFGASLGPRVRELAQIVAAAHDGQAFAAAADDAHRLAGSCALYGFHAAAETLAAVESALGELPADGAARDAARDALVARLDTMAASM